MFCHCSAGFHKKPWEAALGQKIQVDVLESVLAEADRCRFAIHLPGQLRG
jgi:predicted hydrocarbon binding protein